MKNNNFEITDDTLRTSKENILIKLSTGLSPSNLDKSECETLEKIYGKKWLERLGYNKLYNPKPIKKKKVRNETDEDGWTTVLSKN